MCVRACMCVCVLFPYCVGKGIYANKYGFIGGVSYATMVATCCNQNKGTIDIVESFFEKFSNWYADLVSRMRLRLAGGGGALPYFPQHEWHRYGGITVTIL